MHGSSAIIGHYIVLSLIIKIIGVAIQMGSMGGSRPTVKDRDTLIEQSVTQINHSSQSSSL